MVTTPATYPLHLPAISYPTPHSSQTSLHTLDVWLPRDPGSTPARDDRLWVIFIHGGAWRDPLITVSSFLPTVTSLLGSKTPGATHDGPASTPSDSTSHIAGLASISYRLSPYPAHPSDPSSPTDPARNVTHPSHLQDVVAALRYLQVRFEFGERYLLVGHSCGATLGWQVVLSADAGDGREDGLSQDDGGQAPLAAGRSLTATLRKPLGMIGVAGIYDIPGLLDTHADIPTYAEIVEGAFGTLDRGKLRGVSPMGMGNVGRLRGATPGAGGEVGDFGDVWSEGRIALVVHSRDDELVEETQATAFVGALRGVGWGSVGQEGQDQEKGVGKREVGKSVELIWEHGVTHDELWSREGGLGYIIQRGVELVLTTERATK